MFRVASVEEEEAAEADDSEPSEQIHRIEQLLAEADDDFQPAGSIGPEIELCFEEAVHPFQEEFEHEEVVLDRYAAKGAAHEPRAEVGDMRRRRRPIRSAKRPPSCRLRRLCRCAADGRGGGSPRMPRARAEALGDAGFQISRAEGAADRAAPAARIPASVRPTPPRVISWA